MRRSLVRLEATRKACPEGYPSFSFFHPEMAGQFSLAQNASHFPHIFVNYICVLIVLVSIINKDVAN